MSTKILQLPKAERQLLRMTASEHKDRIKFQVEFLNEPFLTELCEALLKYILLGETTHFDSRVMRRMYERCQRILRGECKNDNAEEGVRDEE